MRKLLLRALPLLCASLLAAQSPALDTMRDRARAHPAWVLPSWLRGARPAWCIVGLEGFGVTGLMSHETEVQPGADAFSCVGWIYLAQEKKLAAPAPGLVLWRLTEGDLPIPYADWRYHDILIHVTFFATEIDGRAVNIARWSLYNEGRRSQDLCFFLAIRPYGVNGKLNPIRKIEWRRNSESRVCDIVAINDRDAIVCASNPIEFGAISLADGEVSTFARRGQTPPARTLSSSDGLITSALKFRCTIPPRAAVPFDFVLPRPNGNPSRPTQQPQFETELTHTIAYWRQRARTFTMQLPDQRYAEAYRASLSYQRILRETAAREHSGASTREETWLKLKSCMDRQCAPGVYTWCDAFVGSGDCAGDFTTGRANSEFAALLRRALFYEEDGRIVIAAGVPLEWLNAPGVRISDAVTRFGKFAYSLAHDSRKRVIKLELTGEARPPQGFIFQPPLPGAIEKVAIDGEPMPATPESAMEIPAGARKVEVAYARRK